MQSWPYLSMAGVVASGRWTLRNGGPSSFEMRSCPIGLTELMLRTSSFPHLSRGKNHSLKTCCSRYDFAAAAVPTHSTSRFIIFCMNLTQKSSTIGMPSVKLLIESLPLNAPFALDVEGLK